MTYTTYEIQTNNGYGWTHYTGEHTYADAVLTYDTVPAYFMHRVRLVERVYTKNPSLYNATAKLIKRKVLKLK